MVISISLLTSIVALLLAGMLYDQYRERPRPYKLVWMAGMLLYALASFFQLLWNAGVTQEIVFRLWYLTGAMLVAAYLGTGTTYLLAPRRVGHSVMITLGLLTVLSVILALAVQLRGSISLLEGQALQSANPETGKSFYPAYVGALTAFLNSVGAIALIGGALYSAITYAFRRHNPTRVVSNILIAVGALVSSLGGALERFNVPQPHTLALLIGVVIIFVGFLVSREVFAVYRLPFMRRAQATHQP